ncbi:MAG: phenylacetate--CoA ligase family protein [Bacteroidetes bacterium]|nr:MAG: phenylacetate--CoA ligase family protein [Bacteroidota bacterium]
MMPEIEFKSKEEIKLFQEEKLKDLMNYLSENSKFYQDFFKKNNLTFKEIKTLEDLQKIPVTEKNDLQEKNDDFLCVPKNKIIDYITTSGTLGDPVTFALTDKDLDRLAYNECISFACADGSSEDIYQQMVTIDKRFMAGLAYYLGGRRMGAGIIRVGGGIPELQWDTIKRIKPTAFITVPSFLLKLIEYAEKNGIDYNNTGVKKAVCIGEPIRNEDFELNQLGKRIEEKWKDLKLYSTYASTEMASAFTECSAGKGGHHHPELIIVEFLDENNNPVNKNEAGELTVTTLGVEGMPLLRFKTGDVMKHYTDECTCGRTTMRLGPVLGRKKQMIKYKGTTLYPSSLYDILDDIEEVENYIVEVYTNDIGTDEIVIYIGVKKVMLKHEKILKDRFRAKLRVAPKIVFENPKIIAQKLFPETSRKPIKFVDKRK